MQKEVTEARKKAIGVKGGLVRKHNQLTTAYFLLLIETCSYVDAMLQTYIASTKLYIQKFLYQILGGGENGLPLAQDHCRLSMKCEGLYPTRFNSQWPAGGLICFLGPNQ